MADDFGNDYITVIDDEGEEFELEHLDTAEIGGELYMAFVPADMDENDDDFGLIILKVITEDDEEMFVTIDDDDEMQTAFDVFVKRLDEDES